MSVRCSLAATLLGALWALTLSGCRERRDEPEQAPTYAQIAPMLERACRDCHDTQPEGGYRVTSYLALIGCTQSGRIATEPESERAPLIRVLAREDHRDLLSESERDLLQAWVEAGAPAFIGSVHPAGVIDPRSSDWHGRLAARDDFSALRDPNDAVACGRCHDGAPVRPMDVTIAAPGATACTSCHDEPAGVFDCATCHGLDTRAYPPRDACFFGGPNPDAHPAHIDDGQVRETPLSCETCHVVPDDEEIFAGTHADGHVDVVIDPVLAGDEASFDARSATCSVACHARGGRQATPSWTADIELDCQSCHLSPPEDHYPGTCDRCHAEMGEQPDSLTVGPLHLNGTIDLGDGSGTCGACHGRRKDGRPRDALHGVHTESTLTAELTCNACHEVPEEPHSEGHLDGTADVVFGPLASARGQTPQIDASGRCTNVACHGAGMPGHTLDPRWNEARSDAPANCRGCHSAPPPAPHVQRESCGGSLCHGDEVGLSGTALDITTPGRSRHVNGTVDVAGR